MYNQSTSFVFPSGWTASIGITGFFHRNFAHANEGEENENKIIGLVELYSQTKKVLILAKYAVLYAIFAITIEEEIKSTDKGSKFNRTFESRPGQTFL